MKKELIALSLIASAGLFAGSDYVPHSSKAGCNQCYCTPCCCTPCCVPEPEKCIDCECYVPSFYNLQCAWGFSLDVEFLYWYARETNLAYAVDGVVNLSGSPENGQRLVFSPGTYHEIGTKWDPGVRVGLGWNSNCDGWDLYLTWTYMQNRKQGSTSVPQFGDEAEGLNIAQGDAFLLNPWINASFNFESIRFFDAVSSKWNFHFNQIDLELGKKYWLSPCFTLRPYAGLRGAWWDTEFSTCSTKTTPSSDPSLASVRTIFQDRFDNCVWGVGFVGGLQPTWYICRTIALYANLDGALLWGQFKTRKSEKYFAQADGTTPFGVNSVLLDYKNPSHHRLSQMHAMIDTGIGIRWEETWCCNRYRTALDLGWEHHILFDQNHRPQTEVGLQFTNQAVNINGFQRFAEVTGNIGMGGFVLRARFDF